MNYSPFQTRIILACITIGLGIVCLVGCSSSTPEAPPAYKNPAGFGVEHIKFDGRDITCIVYSGYGVSCDWNQK